MADPIFYRYVYGNGGIRKYDLCDAAEISDFCFRFRVSVDVITRINNFTRMLFSTDIVIRGGGVLRPGYEKVK